MDDDEGADLAQPSDPAHRLQRDQLLLRAEEAARAVEHGRGRSGGAEDVREARDSARRADDVVGRRRGRRLRQRLGGDDVPGQAGRARHHLLLVLGSGAAPPGSRPQVSRLGGAVHGQFLRDAELRGLQRRLLRLHAEGRALPDGAVHLLPDQRPQHRPVRADAHRGRRRRVRELPRGLHGADARRAPAARGRRRARRARPLDDQVLDDSELVPGRLRRAAAASTTS